LHLADAIVVGGGPAGSTCAWKLREAGLDVLVLDRSAFPRTKLCAGWVTPRVLTDLELEPGDYPHSFLTFDVLRLHWKFVSVRFRSQQHSIRRFEFDDFLLRRSGATVRTHQVREIRRDGDDFVVDGRYRSKYLVGAGGTRCPVYKSLFRPRGPRREGLQAATLETEFAYDWRDPSCHLWFFNDGLPGYAWYVPKANGFINIGLGGMAGQLRRRGGKLHDYWARFGARLEKRGLVTNARLQPKGYSYYLRGPVDAVCDRNAYLVGDAAGLATHDLCEGIGPAVESGLLAAQSILTGAQYALDGIAALSNPGWISRQLGRRFTADPNAPSRDPELRRA
jgi:flavin-dependent dehydrogenase